MGFASKHSKRDAELPKHRQALLASIEDDVKQDKKIVAAYYGGSIGNDTTDVYSDIDLRLVIAPEELDTYLVDKTNRPHRWGNVLFFEDLNPSTTYSVAHFDCFVKVDTFYYEPRNMQPSVWLKGIKIIKDTDGLLQKIKKESSYLTYYPTKDEVEFWRTKFFAHFHESYRRVRRNEIYYALSSMNHLRHFIVSAWYMEKGIQPNSFGDWAKYEGNYSELSDRQLSLLKNWECTRQLMDIEHVRKSIATEFERIHSILCTKVELEENPAWVKKVLAMAM